MKTRSHLAAGLLAGVATVTALSVAAPAQAAGRPKIDESSTTATFDLVGGAAVVTGEMDGRPFAGSSSSTLTADDGTLPEPGACEPATVSFHLDGPGRRSLTTEAVGETCGEFVQLPFIVVQVFTGRYEVTDGHPQGLTGTDGFLEVRLGDDGSASTFLIDT
jgi:hypothetical protein